MKPNLSERKAINSNVKHSFLFSNTFYGNKKFKNYDPKISCK